MLDRSTAPPTFTIDEIPLVKPIIVQHNGRAAFLLSDITHEIIKIDWLLSIGRVHQSKALQAQTCWQMLLEGTEGFTSQKLAEQIDFYNLKIKFNVDYQHTLVTIWVYKKFWNEAIRLVQQVFHKPLMCENEFEKYVAIQVEKTKSNEQKYDYCATIEHAKTMFESNVACSNYYKAEQYLDLSIADIRAYYAQYIRSNVGQLYVSGNASMCNVEDLLGMFNSTTSQLNGSSYEMPNIKSCTQIIQKSNASQASIRMSTLTLAKTDVDYIDVMFVNTLLGGYFGSRLMDNLREENGYTYGIYSYLTNFKNFAWWQISTEVGVEVKDLAMAEIKKEIQLLCEVLIDEEELNNVKNAMLQELLSTSDGIHNQMATFRSFNNYTMDIEIINDWVKKIQAYTPQSVLLACQKLVGNAQWITTILS